jgi:hypothetical protein
MSDQVVITRKGTDIGKNIHKRVYVTGPHFDRDVFSSTEDPAEASTFYRHEAEALLALGKWSYLDPQIESLTGASV